MSGQDGLVPAVAAVKRCAAVPAAVALAALTLALVPLAAAASPAPARAPQLRSGSLLVIDAPTSRVLLARNPETPGSIASITKLMTALVVLEGGQPLEETLTIAPEDALHARGTPSRLAPGTRLTRADLLHLALMSSENRAAHALARNYPGGVDACVAAMNRRAAALGMRHAHFDDPTGLSADNVASPGDLALLVNAAAGNARIREYSTDTSYTVRVGRELLEFRNTDSLVRDPNWDVVVQKTGYTRQAGRCLVLKANVDGRALVIVLLDSFGKHTRVADARRIRKWLAAQPEVAAAAPAPASVTAPGILAAVGN